MTADRDPTPEVSFARFMDAFADLLGAHGFAPTEMADEFDPDVPPERAALILLSEVHEWYRAGHIDPAQYEEDFFPDDASWTEFCRGVAAANVATDAIDPTVPDTNADDFADITEDDWRADDDLPDGIRDLFGPNGGENE